MVTGYSRRPRKTSSFEVLNFIFMFYVTFSLLLRVWELNCKYFNFDSYEFNHDLLKCASINEYIYIIWTGSTQLQQFIISWNSLREPATHSSWSVFLILFQVSGDLWWRQFDKCAGAGADSDACKFISIQRILKRSFLFEINKSRRKIAMHN